MLRALAWMLAGIAAAMLIGALIMPAQALGAIVPLVGIVMVGVVIVVAAGFKGKKADAEREARLLAREGPVSSTASSTASSSVASSPDVETED